MSPGPRPSWSQLGPESTSVAAPASGPPPLASLGCLKTLPGPPVQPPPLPPAPDSDATLGSDSQLGGSFGCGSDPPLHSLSRTLDSAAPKLSPCRPSASLRACLVGSRPRDVSPSSLAVTASSGVRAGGGGARPGGRGEPGGGGAGVPGPINLHQAAAGGPLGANGKMEGPVGRAGRASFVLLPAPLAAAPAPPRPSPAAARPISASNLWRGRGGDPGGC